MNIKKMGVISAIVLLLIYSLVGVSTRVDDIKSLAPSAIESRGWKILRYEGYEYGSWGRHGGKVWYHVQDVNQDNIYYRVFITKWGNELHFYYGAPEKLQRLNIDGSEIRIN